MKRYAPLVSCFVVVAVLFCSVSIYAAPTREDRSKNTSAKANKFKSLKVPFIPGRLKKTVAVVPASTNPDGSVDTLTYMFWATFQNALVNSKAFRTVEYNGNFNWAYETPAGRRLAQKAGYSPQEIASWPLFNTFPQYILTVSSNDLVGDEGGVAISYADKNRSVASETDYKRRFSSIRIWNVDNMQPVASYLCEANGVTLKVGGVNFDGNNVLGGDVELTKTVNKQLRGAAEKCLREVVEKLYELPSRYRVVKIDNPQNVKIEAGTNAGIKAGDKFSIVRNDKDVGSAEVASCQDRFCDLTVEASSKVTMNDVLVEHFTPVEKNSNTPSNNNQHAKKEVKTDKLVVKTDTSGVYSTDQIELYYGSEVPYAQHQYLMPIISHGSNTGKALTNLATLAKKQNLDGVTSIYCDFTQEGAQSKAVLFSIFTTVASLGLTAAFIPANVTSLTVSPMMYSHHFCEGIGFRYNDNTVASKKSFDEQESISRVIHSDSTYDKYIKRTDHKLPKSIPGRVDHKVLAQYMSNACSEHLSEDGSRPGAYDSRYMQSLKADFNAKNYGQMLTVAKLALGISPTNTAAAICGAYAEVQRNNYLDALALLNRAEGSFITSGDHGYMAAMLSYFGGLDRHSWKHLQGLATNETNMQTEWEKNVKLAKKKKLDQPQDIIWPEYSADSYLLFGLLANKWESKSVATPYFINALARDGDTLDLLEQYKSDGMIEEHANLKSWVKKANKKNKKDKKG